MRAGWRLLSTTAGSSARSRRAKGGAPAPLPHRWCIRTEEEISRLLDTHIKDCYLDYLDPTAQAGMSYYQVSATKRLWAEPGLGVVDFDAVIAVMPPDYDGHDRS